MIVPTNNRIGIRIVMQSDSCYTPMRVITDPTHLTFFLCAYDAAKMLTLPILSDDTPLIEGKRQTRQLCYWKLYHITVVTLEKKI